MRVLLDECLPRRLKALFTGHEVETVPEAGWAGIKNGRLLSLAQSRFDVFVTVDRNLSFQNPVDKLTIGVLVLRARSNRFQDLAPLLNGVEAVLDGAAPGIVHYLPRTDR